MKRMVLGVLALATLTGCEPAIIASALRPSDKENFYMETRCAELDMRDNAAMQQLFPKYDGWRLIYVSEYTTGNKFGTHAAVCFERPKKETPIYGRPPEIKVVK